MQPNGTHDSYNRVFAISEPKLFCQVFSQTIRKTLVLLIFDDSMHLRKKGEIMFRIDAEKKIRAWQSTGQVQSWH